ncbi:MAG TPA: serine hydrolase [Longimicrobium sp.]|nr:serine hydrolase [Longimicrobium sp.]
MLPPARPLTPLVALLLVLAACGSDSPTTGGGEVDPPPLQIGDGWAVSTPAAEGMDPARLRALGERISAGGYGQITSVLVARNGRLVWERYAAGWSVEQAHTMQSVSKSVTSLLAGIAAGDGRLAVDASVAGFFPEYQPIQHLDARKQAMRVEDLLTMRTGLDWSETVYEGSPLQQLNQSTGDWVRMVMDWPMREQPGTRWEYVSGGTIVLGGVIGRAEGKRVDTFAAERLFEPLQMRGFGWYRNPSNGFPHTGGGLLLRPRDALKIGQLVLDGGRWNGQQIVPSAWIEASTRRVVAFPRSLGQHQVDYGWLWWIGSLDDPMNPRREPGDVIVASGSGGQWIFIVPRHSLVMIATGANQDARWSAAFDFLYTDVLPAIR